MHSASYFTSPSDPWNLIGTAQPPQIVDTGNCPARVA